MKKFITNVNGLTAPKAYYTFVTMHRSVSFVQFTRNDGFSAYKKDTPNKRLFSNTLIIKFDRSTCPKLIL